MSDKLEVGNYVIKTGGEYHFQGVIVAVFCKRDHETIRVVVENDDGLLMIMNLGQIRKVSDDR